MPVTELGSDQLSSVLQLFLFTPERLLGTPKLDGIGVDCVVALALVTTGLWALIGRVALVVPGVVLLWIVLPSRPPFVLRRPTEESHRRRP